MDARSLRKTFLVVIGWEKICISKDKRGIYNCKFSKVNALKKGRPGASQEEGYLKLRPFWSDIGTLMEYDPSGFQVVGVTAKTQPGDCETPLGLPESHGGFCKSLRVCVMQLETSEVTIHGFHR